ncbi:type II secretion system F family protein [Marinomonas sp. TI.3.20]|uniref:type II secretion system F family protein n=1 Tax=Marinomonas sp. TI.3.20 TaxID=3121296 RepID=UPI00311E173A
MPKFIATYIDHGIEKKEMVTAENKTAVFDILALEGIQALKVVSADSVDLSVLLSPSELWSAFKSYSVKRLDPRERSLILRRIANLVKTKQRLTTSLALLAESMPQAPKRVALEIKDNLEAGLDLSQALDKCNKDIPPTITAIIRSSSANGGMHEGLINAAKFDEAINAQAKTNYFKLFGALTQLYMGIALTMVSSFVLTPIIMSPAYILKDDPIIKLSVSAGDWIMYGSIAVGAYITFILILQTLYKGINPVQADQLLVKLPFVKKAVLSQRIYVACHSLSFLFRTSVSVGDILKLVHESLPPGKLSNELIVASRAARNGETWSDALKSLDPTDRVALENAETKIQIAETLVSTADYYMEEFKSESDKVINRTDMAGIGIMVAASLGLTVISIIPTMISSTAML